MDLRATLIAALAASAFVPLPCSGGMDGGWEAQVAGVLGAAQAARAERGLPGKPREYDCGSGEVSVFLEDVESAALACEGFQRARRFMAERGYRAKDRLRILVAERFPERYRKQVGDLLDNMHGFYDTDTREVHMKTLRRFLRTPADRTPQGVGPSRELYISYIAHEAAHHISVQAYARAPKLPPRAQGEFISYSLQLETMAEPLRREIVRRFRASGGSAFSGMEAVNDFSHDADPGGFAVRSYLFLKGTDGEAVLRAFMEGKIEPSGF
ncbi:MAG: DUF6639 family protein [Elusimicrobiota bacterium]